MKLGKRIFISLLCVCIVMIVILAAFDFAGLHAARNQVQGEQNKYGYELYTSNAQGISEVGKESAKIIAKGQSLSINNKFMEISNDLKMLSFYLSDLYYKNKPAQSLYGDEYLFLQPGVNKRDIYDEYNKIKSAQDMMVNFLENDQNKVYYVSASGIFLSKISKEDYKKSSSVDMRKRDWYKKAVDGKKICWSDAYIDTVTGEMVITCSVPVYGKNDVLKGVVAQDFAMNYFCSEILKSESNILSYSCLIDKQGKFVLGSEPDKKPTDYVSEEFYNDVIKKAISPEDQDGSMVTSEFITGYAAIESTDWNLVVILNHDEMLQPANNIKKIIVAGIIEIVNQIEHKIYMKSILYVSIITIAVLLIAFTSKRLTKTIINPIEKLQRGTREISEGNLNQKIEITTGGELKDLSIEFNNMAVNLKKQMRNLEKVTAEKNTIETELKIARTIQTSMLPTESSPFLAGKGIDLHAMMQPAKEVGGDFYDFFMLDENRMAFVIADVSGKGVPAALFMVITKTLIKNQAQQGLSPKDILITVNESLCENNNANMFVTAIIGILNLQTGKIILSNAGHNHPLIYRKGKGFSWFRPKSNFVLAGVKDINYVNETIDITKGDKIFLYTDGVTESLNRNNELYADKRLIDCLNDGFISDKTGSVDILNYVEDSIKKFVGGGDQSDDITMMIIDYYGVGKIKQYNQQVSIKS